MHSETQEETTEEVQQQETGPGASEAAQSGDTAGETEKTQAETVDLQAEVDKLKDTLLRERADFINYRRRSQQEKDEANKRATEKILGNLVPVLDAFDQIFTASTDNNASVSSFLEGAALIQKQMWQVFSDLGVAEIDPGGAEFDPARMEALSVSESAEAKHEVVGQVYQKGYEMDGRVIRPARVAVVKPAPKKETSTEAPQPEAQPGDQIQEGK